MGELISAFERQFRLLHDRSTKFVQEMPEGFLYRPSGEVVDAAAKLTVGENILRSAALVEMAFGGITTRLWDDPFEWTLPETLDNAIKVRAYLDEVEATRQRGFLLFKSDEDLSRVIPAPRELRPICEVLLDTLGGARYYQGRAFAIFETIRGRH